LRRAARLGDGWLGAVPLTGLSPAGLESLVATLRAHCTRVGRDPSTVEMTLRMAPHPRTLGTPELRELLLAYAGHGIIRFTFDVGGRDLDTVRRRLDALAGTAADVRRAAGVPAGAA
jgi:alkanesulfonate monooxygenase SsuD/methylene tetrahydromethanopterin reductase-like flavin-dependent oxidoreductase (luciferase family)